LIPLSASGVASKPLCPCMLDTLWAQTMIICKWVIIQTCNSAKWCTFHLLCA